MKKQSCILSAFLLIFFLSLKSQTYNYYFGNIHAHTSYSDGNQDSVTSMMTTPLQDFNYAKNSQHIDFYGISEHNHFSAGMITPIHFHRGLADADSVNVDGTFVAMYGMEWGVISGGGHVLVYGYDSLIGWDNNDYDVYVAKNDYSGLWKKINEKPGAFGYLAHPQTTDYDSLFSTSFSLSADNAIIGMAARSGPATSSNNTYSNPSTSNYIARFNDALKKGYHLGVGLDHDTHNSVFGRQTAGRMVVLATSLTRANILDAIKRMRFYSSDDWNAKVNFTIYNQPMGSSLTHTGTPIINVNVVDPDIENVSSIAIYYGIPGSGISPSILATMTNTANVFYTHTIANNSTYYYYLKITQADGNIIWTSPIWYTRNDAVTNNPPIANFTISTSTICVGQSLTLTDNSLNAPSDWNWTLNGALPNVSTNQHVIATYNTPGTYTISLAASNSFGTNTFTNTITVTPLPNVIATTDSICLGETATLTASGANTYSWSTGSTNASISITPTISALYSVTGTLNGCSKSVNTFVIVNTCVGISELQKSNFITYPNPADNLLIVDFKELVNEKFIELYDEFGKLLFYKTTTEPILQIDVSNYSNGIYMLKIKIDSKHFTSQKFIINRK